GTSANKSRADGPRMRARFQRGAGKRAAKGPVHPGTAGPKRGRPPRSRIYLCQSDDQLLCGYSEERKREFSSFDWLLRHMGSGEHFFLCSEVQISGRETCIYGRGTDIGERFADVGFAKIS